MRVMRSLVLTTCVLAVLGVALATCNGKHKAHRLHQQHHEQHAAEMKGGNATSGRGSRYQLGGQMFTGHIEVTSSSDTNPKLRNLCDGDVNQEAGYYRIEGSRNLNMFYWFFESRDSPKEDPIILWMTGGPGCSDGTALFEENGPCLLKKGTDFPERNKYGWNEHANLIFIDQPAGVGYSYGDAQDADRNEKGVAMHVGNFLREFYKDHEHMRHLPLYIIGESYGGHYVPAVAQEVMDDLPLEGIGIGNGLTVPEIQYKYYPELAYTYAKKVLNKPVISYPVYLFQNAAWPTCQQSITKCQNDTSQCANAQRICNAIMLAPYQLTGMNPYDIRLKCEAQPLCYDFSNVDTFLNDKDVKDALGVPEDIKWADCNNSVNFMFQEDWMKNFDEPIKELLHADIDVLIYAGDMDFICNWLGNKAWTLQLEWDGKDDFNSAEDIAVTIDGEEVGELRNADKLTFFRVYKAGHLSPMDQPKVTLEMVKALTKVNPPPSTMGNEGFVFANVMEHENYQVVA